MVRSRSRSRSRSGRSRSRSRSRSKGSPSKTRRGKLDYVTHEGDRVYDEAGHWVRRPRAPYMKRSRSRSRKRSLHCTKKVITGVGTKKRPCKTGTKSDVWKGLAKQTSGGLRKTDLIQNKRGKIVSKKLSALAKKNNYLGLKRSRSRSRKRSI